MTTIINQILQHRGGKVLEQIKLLNFGVFVNVEEAIEGSKWPPFNRKWPLTVDYVCYRFTKQSKPNFHSLSLKLGQMLSKYQNQLLNGCLYNKPCRYTFVGHSSLFHQLEDPFVIRHGVLHQRITQVRPQEPSSF